jgi:NADH-quinone oxidoreductase subunit N
MSTVALAENLFVLFVGLELAGFSSYILVAFNKESKFGSEGGMKYFMVGSASSGVGLYGLSLLYLWAGTLQVDSLALAWSNIGQEILPYVALGLMLVGFGFKVSAAPFHFAAPDAYAGASSPFAGLLATASKAMGMVGLFRILLVITLPEGSEGSAIWLVLLGVMAAITMTWGNLAALGSKNPKRMLAYSSVAHAGYMMAALTAVGVWNLGEASLDGAAEAASEAVLTALLFHLVVLVAFKMGAFLVIGLLEHEGEVSDDRTLSGLAKRSPLLATTMFIFMLSLGRRSTARRILVETPRPHGDRQGCRRRCGRKRCHRQRVRHGPSLGLVLGAPDGAEQRHIGVLLPAHRCCDVL